MTKQENELLADELERIAHPDSGYSYSGLGASLLRNLPRILTALRTEEQPQGATDASVELLTRGLREIVAMDDPEGTGGGSGGGYRMAQCARETLAKLEQEKSP